MFKAVRKIIEAFDTKMKEDRADAYAGQATLFILLSFFPFIMFLLTLMQYLPFTEETLIDLICRFTPVQVAKYIEVLINELYAAGSGTVLSITVIAALWTASKGMLSIYYGLNSIYRTKETRNYFILRFIAMLYTLVFAVLLILLLALFVFGNQIVLWLNNTFPITSKLNQYAGLVVSLRYTVGIGILLLFFMFMYKFLPSRPAKLHYQLPGAIIASLGWVGFSYLFSFYIDNMSNMSATYGSLTAIVLCILWLYTCMNIVFFGAEVNSILANKNVQDALKHFFKRDKLSE